MKNTSGLFNMRPTGCAFASFLKSTSGSTARGHNGRGCRWYSRINRAEWIAVIGSIAAVLMAELFNTAIEQLCNLVSPGHNLIIGRKDLSAAAVLVSAIMAAVTGLVIF